MPNDKWIEEKFSNVEGKVSELGEGFKKLADGFERLTQHETRIDVIEKLNQDHEQRIRAIEHKQWIVNLVGLIFTLAAGALVKQSIDMIDAAKQTPQLTAKQIAEIVVKVNKEQSKG